MAYSVVSQNNTTTTLADENGNVITVPARVTLATSTDYTIKKVNNNSVDLEGGDGKIIRGVPACVVLAGGGDSHNKGYYATQAALEEAYPTGEAGDYAIVGSTDTVWIWDEDTSAWKDSDQKGQVTSVNGQTGAVTLSIPDAVQYSTMPTASADNLGDIVQFIGITDVNYTNGYFYKCVSDGQEPATYSWTRVDVQPTPSELPSQTGNDGKFLTTDGTDASWSDKPLVNESTGTNSLNILGGAYNLNSNYSVAIGKFAMDGQYSVSIGYNAESRGGSNNVVIGALSRAPNNTQWSVLLGSKIQLFSAPLNNNIACINTSGNEVNPPVPNQFYYANTNGLFVLVSSDGTIPADRFTTTPSADGTYVPTLSISSGTATRSWSAPSKITNYTSNIITEIPQDINLELSSGTLTLKAGSKVYVPNGDGVFDTVTIANDISVSSWGGGNTDIMVFVRNGTNFTGESLTNCYSGSSQPTPTNATAYWYDTANNVIKFTNDTGSTWTTNSDSLPICIISRSSGTITGIKQIFNGFGYVGSTVFALPGVKGLVPNGRNTDGTLKNTTASLTSVQTTTFTNQTQTSAIRIGNNYLATGIFPYDEKTNYNYNTTIAPGNERTQVNAGSVTTSSGTITLFNIKTVFHALDYNDSEYISNCAMPSKDKYIDLTLGASGAAYTAPADGYIKLTKNATAAGQYIDIYTTDMGVGTLVTASGAQALRGFCPVAKGDRVTVSYTAAGATGTFRFVYANGAK